MYCLVPFFVQVLVATSAEFICEGYQQFNSARTEINDNPSSIISNLLWLHKAPVCLIEVD